MQVGNVMSRDVHIMAPDQTLRDAAATMKRLDAGVLPVGEKDKLIGMITDRDIAVRGIAEGKRPGRQNPRRHEPRGQILF